MLRLLIASVVPLLGQSLEPRISIPSLGYAFDESSQAVRWISGIPGAAQWDMAVPFEAAIRGGFLYSRAKIGVVTTKSGSIAVAEWSTSARLTEIATELAELKAVAFSRSGDEAALSDGQTVELWSGLRGQAQRVKVLPAEANAVAIAGDGTLAIATSSGIDADNRRLLSGVAISGLRFAGNDLFAVGGTSLYVIRDWRQANGAAQVIGLSKEASSLVVSRDGNWVAASAIDDILLANVNEGVSRALGCNCQAMQTDSLEGNLVVAARDSAGGALVLLDLGLTPQVARIPSFGGNAQ